MQFPFIYLIVFCLLVILFLVWYIQRTKQRKKFLEQEHKYDQALLEVHAIETEYYISLLRDKQEETQKLLSQKENEIRKLADEKAQLCNVIFKETSIYKTIERLSRQDKTKKQTGFTYFIGKWAEETSFYYYGDIQGLYRVSAPNLS